MKRLALVLVLLFSLTIIMGCSAASRSAVPIPGILQGAPANDSTQSKSSEGGGAYGAYPAAAPTAAAAPAAPPMPEVATGNTDGGPLAAPAQLPVDRMVVYNGTIRLEVQNAEETATKIADVLKANQGYISNRQLDRDSKGNVSGSVTIRIPAGALDTTLNQIKALGVKVLHEDGKSDDVTQEYVDLDARRKNLEAYEVELTKLLDTMRERTNKAEDLLAIYNQLTQVRGQIEQIKGRQNYLSNTSSFATYTIYLVPQQVVQVDQPQGWNPGATANDSFKALLQTLQVLGDIAIGFVVYLVPVLIILALPFVILFLIARWLWQRRKPRRVVTA